MLAVLVYGVELDVEALEAIGERFVIASDAMKRFEASVGGRHSFAHHLDDRVTSGNFDVFLSASRGAGCAYFVVHKKAGADDGRIAHASGDFPGEPGGGGGAGDVALRVDCQAIDCAGDWVHHDFFNVVAPFEFFWRVQKLREFFLPFEGCRGRGANFRMIALSMRARRCGSGPSAGSWFRTFVDCETLRACADDEDAIRFVHHGFCDERRTLIPRIEPTAPAWRVGPCITEASSSTTPSSLGKPP